MCFIERFVSLIKPFPPPQFLLFLFVYGCSTPKRPTGGWFIGGSRSLLLVPHLFWLSSWTRLKTLFAGREGCLSLPPRQKRSILSIKLNPLFFCFRSLRVAILSKGDKKVTKNYFDNYLLSKGDKKSPFLPPPLPQTFKTLIFLRPWCRDLS